MKPTDPSKDMDDYYQENGEPTKPPNEMEERMFNVVKFLIIGNNENPLTTKDKHLSSSLRLARCLGTPGPVRVSDPWLYCYGC